MYGFCKVWVCVCVYGFCNVCVCMCACFGNMCGCAYVWVFWHYVWVCVFVDFVMCRCFGNIYTCIYCVLYCLYCASCIVFYVYLFLVFTSVKTTATE